MVAAVAAVAGIGAGYLLAAPTRGHDVALSSVTVSGDDRSVSADGGSSDTLTAEETATTVRLHRHVAFQPGPTTGVGRALVVHLAAPLGDRRLVDATDPGASAGLIWRRPAVLPAGYAPKSTFIDFDAGRCVLIYASPGGGVIRITEEPPVAGETPAGSWRVTRNGRTTTVTGMAYGFDRVDPADLARTGESAA
jgi:hypothetical protein